MSKKRLFLRVAFWVMCFVVAYLNFGFALHYGVLGFVPMETLGVGYPVPWWAYTGLGITSLIVIFSVVISVRWKAPSSIILLFIGVVQFFFLWLYFHRVIIFPAVYFILTIGLVAVMRSLVVKVR